MKEITSLRSVTDFNSLHKMDRSLTLPCTFFSISKETLLSMGTSWGITYHIFVACLVR